MVFPWLANFKTQAFIIALLALIFYGNTYNNGFALDDDVVIVKNEYVLEGIKGIPDILTTDAYQSHFKHLNTTDQLKGGRYRPLSVITFAIEQQFFGAIPQDKVDSVIGYGMSYEMNEPYEQHFLRDMHIRHLANVLLFAISVVVLLYFLRYVVFKPYPAMAFIAALLFTIHPIHIEVIANVKSRDEILSLLFICLTFIFAFKFRENQNKKLLLVVALGSYFLAFLSKEYAITLIALLPIMFYLFNGNSLRKSVVATLPYAVVAVVYVFIRFQVTGAGSDVPIEDIQINPYAFADPAQKIATEIATSLNYLKLLILPYPLSSDYSYNQIPYKDFSYPLVWFSLAVHLGLFAAFFYYFKRRNVLSFAIAFYLLGLLMVNNFIFDIGATMGERLIYHASVGFVIAVAYFLYKGFEKIKPVKTREMALTGLLVMITVLCGIKTIARNRDWKNNQTLYFQDIKTSPNSFLVNVNVASLLVNESDYEPNEAAARDDLHQAIPIFNKVLSMQSTYVLGLMNRGIAYLKLGEPDSFAANLDMVKSLYPNYPPLPGMYYRAAMLYASKKQFDKAKAALQVVLRLNPGDQAALNALNDITAGTMAN